MAKLVYVYRSDEISCVKIGRRQLSLIGGENLNMLMDLNSKGLVFDHPQVKGKTLEEFTQKYQILSPDELKKSLEVSSGDFTSVLSQSVPCVGCRRSVERLFYQLMLSGHPTLDPIVITDKGILTVTDEKLQSPQAICTLLHKHNILLNSLLENQIRNKKNSRCGLHSLDSFRSRPFSEIWKEVWNCMKPQCKEEIAVVEAQELHNTLDSYLKKHKFCQECRTKVEKAYALLVSDYNPAKEKGYVAALYSGIRRCLADKHIHLQTKAEFIDCFIKRAEPELNGSNSRHRERHAKTLEIAQEEVLTCIGMCIYERLRRIHMCLKEEENACQVLGAVAVHALCRSFDMAVETKRGISNLELLYVEISRAERAKEQRKEQKKLKKKKKKSEKRIMEISRSCHNCEAEPVPDKFAYTLNNNDIDIDGDDDDDDHSDDNIICDDNDVDVDDNIVVMCDGTIINERTPIKICCSSNIDVIKDALSVSSSSCHSCENIINGCIKSIDAGYVSEPSFNIHNHGGRCSLLSSNTNSRTSSIASSPECSEITCSDGFCNHHHQNHNHNNLTSKQKQNDSSHNLFRTSQSTTDRNDCRYGHKNGELTLSLEQMLEDSPSDDEDVSYIPDEFITSFKSRHKNIEKTREEFRENLRNNFAQLCLKKRLVGKN